MKLREIKIKVGDRSAEVQKALFERGCTNIGYSESRYIFVNKNGIIMGSDDREMFNDSAFKEVSADKILGIKNTEFWDTFSMGRTLEYPNPKIKKTKKPKKLKAGMPVLCRDNNDDEWSIDVFIKHSSGLYKVYKFDCFHTNWSQCIPYKGNEHLLGTTDNEGGEG